MNDFDDLLRRSAPSPGEPVDVDGLQRRARRRTTVRRSMLGAAILVFAAVSAVGLAAYPTSKTTELESAGPSPAPTTMPATTTTVPAVQTIDCGEVNRLSGWPTTIPPRPEPLQCIVDAFATGADATFTLIETDAGSGGLFDPDIASVPPTVRSTYRIVDVEVVEVTTRRADEATYVRTCTSLVIDNASLIATECAGDTPPTTESPGVPTTEDLSLSPVADPDPIPPVPGPTVPTVPATAVPPVPGPTVPTIAVDCGEVNRLSGWPTTIASNPAPLECIVDAFSVGTGASLVVIEGDFSVPYEETPQRMTTTYEVIGPMAVRVSVQKAGGSASVTRCGQLTINQAGLLEAGDC